MFIGITIIIEIIITFVIRSLLRIEIVNDMILIMINTLIVMTWLTTVKHMSKTQRAILAFGYITRLLLLLIDRYLFNLPYGTKDAASFDLVAYKISNNLNLLKENLYGSFWTKYLGILYYLTGSGKYFAKSINSIFAIGIGYNIFYASNKIKLKEYKFLEIILVFLPQSLLLTISLLRAAPIAFFISLSIRRCVEYIVDRKKTYIPICIVDVLLAAILHSGVIFLIFGYIFLFSFFDVEKKCLKLSIKKVLVFSIFVLLSITVYYKDSRLFGAYFKGKDIEKVAHSMGESYDAGSAYLTGIEVNSLKDIIIYTIPKTIYFVCSPMPWDCRGLKDAISFLTDSAIYIYLIYIMFKNYRYLEKEDKSVIKALGIGVLLAIIVYSLGTVAAGTAIRHRHKFLGLLTFLAMISKSRAEEKKI